ncbi:MAG: mechanosensitive ion channel domain-containing protein [Cyanobacteria bacterium J06635_15]
MRLSQRRFRVRPPLRKLWQWVGLGLLLLVLVGGVWSQSAQAQLTPLNSGGEAPIVVDGRVVFKVRGIDELTATERAYTINAELRREVRRPDLAVIEAVQTDNLVYLQSQHSEEILVTITQADVLTPGRQPNRQARLWAEDLEQALRRGQLERSPDYLRQATLYSLILLGGAIAIHFMLRVGGRFGTRYLNRWFEYTPNPSTTWEKPLKLFWQLALLGFNVGLWLIVVLYITDIFPQARSWRYTIFNFLTADIIDLGRGQYSALELLLLLGLTVGLWFVAQAIAQFFRRYVLSRARLDQRIQDILSVLIQYALIFLGAIVLLQIWGIDASSLAIVASVLGVGIGFGVQNITNNFISGFIITLERPIQVGDFVNVGDLVGTVARVGARSTEIRTLDQVTIIIPNSRFLESEVINWSHGNPVSRLRVPVGVAYGSDIARVKTALLEAIKRHPEVLLRPKPEVWFQGFGESALNFEVMVWTGEPRKQFRVRSDLNYEIETSLRHHGIEIPFPQRDLHLRSPQLDELVGLLKQRVPGISTVPARPSSPEPSHPSTPVPLTQPTEVQKQTLSPATGLWSNLDLEALTEAMQGGRGVEMRTDLGEPVSEHHDDQSDPAPTCFTGSAAVAWLMQQRDYTREGAILVGQWLLQKGLIHGVIETQDFEDSDYCYQFYREHPSGLGEGQLSISERVTLDEEAN